MARISNSKLDLYQTCPKKYWFKYVQKVQADVTRTPLLFGSAMDSALNFILECKRDGVPHSIEQAKQIFATELSKWSGQNRLDYFKNEVPEEWLESNDPDLIEKAVHGLMLRRGVDCIDVYEKEILSQIESVIEVQTKGTLNNAEGDTFEFIVDAVVKLKNGPVVVLDNKTASAKYKKKAVIESQQLSLYLENYPDIKHAAYAVLIKNPAKEKGLTHQLLVDEIPEETKAASFKLLEDTLLKIKNEEFPCNYKGCMAFGKECEYSKACSYGDYTGLVPTYRNEKDKT